MSQYQQQFEAELSRLEQSAKTTAPRSGLVIFVAKVPSGASALLDRVVSLLRLVDKAILTSLPTEEEWRKLLPDWFVTACAPALTEEQAERWLVWWKSLPEPHRHIVEQEQRWSLNNWLYWMEPANRQWYWWDARVAIADTEIVVEIQVESWPFPYGSLRWLFTAAGAASFEQHHKLS
jgi:hypothetical protein